MAFRSLMNATRSRSPSIGRGGGGGNLPSRSNDNRRSAVSSRCATMSRTRQAPASVGRSQSSAVSVRRSATISRQRGRNNGRVSMTGIIPWSIRRERAGGECTSGDANATGRHDITRRRLHHRGPPRVRAKRPPGRHSCTGRAIQHGDRPVRTTIFQTARFVAVLSCPRFAAATTFRTAAPPRR